MKIDQVNEISGLTLAAMKIREKKRSIYA